MSESDGSASVRDLVLTVFETNGRLVEAGNALVRPAGLTTAWWQVLGALGYSPTPLPVAHIARNMGLTRQAVQRVVDLLAERNLVSLQPNPHHQRAKLVVLTQAGRIALSGAEKAVAPLDQSILDRIGAERLATAVAVLREMNDVIGHTFAPATNVGSPTLPEDTV
ncbi:MAG: MarR family transcriptional regulator [Methylobacterium sp.]|uniref:MarR family winged helix-turn-helix transcriptional regulator n=1 Tax=Methylobacterium sp. TaxID=409 RepID=UPI0025E496F0|nr:MarR family transcriptional regulator [Methylobacterium sp.]MBX9930813.1 MarR family transcriptional regulator [Methylobacterium sp.]